jgi:hypothetical protein
VICTALPVKKSIYCNFEVPTDKLSKIAEIPGSRNMRPTSPNILELHRLYNAYELTKLSNVGPNTHVYLGTAKDGESAGKKNAKQQVKQDKCNWTISLHVLMMQVLFLRSFSLHSDSATPRRSLEIARDDTGGIRALHSGPSRE